MNKEYLPYYTELDEKYKRIYMEFSKEELIDHLIGNIKNGEVLLMRIDKSIEYLEKHKDLKYTDYLLGILKGSNKE